MFFYTNPIVPVRMVRDGNPNPVPQPVPATGGNPPSPSGGSHADRESVDEFIQSVLREHGSRDQAIRALATDVIRQRRLKQKARGEHSTLAQSLEGAVVLRGDEAKLWNTWKPTITDKDLSTVDPTKVKDRLKLADKLETDAITAKKSGAFIEAAGILRLDPKPLRKFVPEDAEIELRGHKERNEKTKELEEVKVPYIRIGDTWQELHKYLDAEVGENFLKAMAVTDEAANGSKGSNGTGTGREGSKLPSGQRSTGSQRQTTDGKGGNTADMSSAVARGMQNRYQTPSQRNTPAGAGSGKGE